MTTTLSEVSLETLITSCDPKKNMQLHSQKISDKHCWFVSKKWPDFNVEVRHSPRGFVVEVYNSTHDLKSNAPTSGENVVKGLTLLLADEADIDAPELVDLFQWGDWGMDKKNEQRHKKKSGL